MAITLPAQSTNMIVEAFPAGPLQCNCSIIGDKTTKHAVVVDPGGNADHIMARVEFHGLTVVAIIHTHAHLDHILASAEIQKRTGAKMYLHEGDLSLWDQLEDQCAMFGVPYTPTPAPDALLEHEEELNVCSGKAIHTPGHTKGSMSFYFPDDDLLVAGDTLFQMGVGRTDLPGGDHKEIEVSIVERLFAIDGDARVITGHGPDTSLEFERRANPFFGKGM